MIGITELGDPVFDIEWMSWVSLCKPAILITKNPEILHLMLQRMIITNVIVHCTITGYGGTKLEPGVPVVRDAVVGMGDIAKLIGWDRIVLRVDPIIPYDIGILPFNVKSEIITRYGQEVWDKLRKRISFLDAYNHVKDRFKAAGIPLPPYEFHAPIERRMAIWEKLGKPEVCGEPDMPCNGCLSQVDMDILGVKVDGSSKSKQRTACMCLDEKRQLIGYGSECGHGCLYCYRK